LLFYFYKIIRGAGILTANAAAMQKYCPQFGRIAGSVIKARKKLKPTQLSAYLRKVAGEYQEL